MAAEGVSAVFHGTVVAGPIVSNSKNVAKFAAAEKALVVLRDSDEGELLKELCDCKQRMVVDGEKAESGADQRSDDEGGALDEQEEMEVAAMLVEDEY